MYLRRQFSILVPALIYVLSLMSCMNQDPVTYSEVTEIETARKCTFTGVGPIRDWAVYNGDMIVVQREDGVVRIDGQNGETDVLFDVGQGPESVLEPWRISACGDTAWVCSFHLVNFVYRIQLNGEPPRIEQFKLPLSSDFDDVVGLADGSLGCSYVYWDDELVRVISPEGKQAVTLGQATHMDLMKKFNVNEARLYAVGDTIYAIQSAVPEIQVLDRTKPGGEIQRIELNPPFYKPLSEPYNVQKYDEKGHREWMAHFTHLDEITGSGRWLLIRFETGFEWEYYYELLNLDNLRNRYYWGPMDAKIGTLREEDNSLVADALRETEDGMEWLEYRFSPSLH